MANVMSLPIFEPVRFDRRRIADIVGELGETAARNTIRLALGEIETALFRAGQAMDCHDDTDALAHAESPARLAWQLGLPTLATVAQNLRDCIQQRNHIAVAAIGARLRRVGNRSLTTIRRDTGLS